MEEVSITIDQEVDATASNPVFEDVDRSPAAEAEAAASEEHHHHEEAKEEAEQAEPEKKKEKKEKAHHEAPSDSEGYWVEKQGIGAFGKQWQKRWMVFSGSLLRYFITPGHVNPQGEIDLSQVQEVRTSNNGATGSGGKAYYAFEVVMQPSLKRTYCIRCETEDVRESLMNRIKESQEEAKSGDLSTPEKPPVPQFCENRELNDLEKEAVKTMHQEIGKYLADVRATVTVKRFYFETIQSENAEAKSKVLDKELKFDITHEYVGNIEYDLDTFSKSKNALVAKFLRISYRMDNSVSGVVGKTWMDLGVDKHCSEFTHTMYVKNASKTIPNLLYSSSVAHAGGIFNQVVNDILNSTHVIPVKVNIDMDKLHEAVKAREESGDQESEKGQKEESANDSDSHEHTHSEEHESIENDPDMEDSEEKEEAHNENESKEAEDDA